jgi:hypothetical protein
VRNKTDSLRRHHKATQRIFSLSKLFLTLQYAYKKLFSEQITMREKRNFLFII